MRQKFWETLGSQIITTWPDLHEMRIWPVFGPKRIFSAKFEEFLMSLTGINEFNECIKAAIEFIT